MKLVPRLASFKTLHSSPRWSSEHGAGRFNAILSALILVSMIYVGFKVIPVLMSEFQFKDGLTSIAQFGSAQRRSLDQIRTAVMDEAQKDDLPVQPEDVKVEATNGNVQISVDYSVTVDLSVYQWTLNFHPSTRTDALF